ncbi:unnamed protein product, partial [Rotaria sp. Silwood1]
MGTKNIGRIKYQDGEVVIKQNQQKQTDFFFTPFPYLRPEETQCYENVFSDRVELGLQVELYTPQLIRAVKDYVYKYQSSLCGNTTSLPMCDVSLLPMHSIRLVQKDTRPNNTDQKYTLVESWYSATLLLQSMKFIMYTSNITVCEQLRKALTENCQLPNFELQYSLHGQHSAQRQLEVNTEHVTSTNMYNQIRAQFPTAETVVLTGNDFKKLLSEATDHITMTLRLEEGFEHLADPIAIDKLLQHQLSNQQARLEETDKKLWEDLYWTSELTRPDRLAKVLNSILRKERQDSERFIYDRQAAKDAMRMDLTEHDILRTDVTGYEIVAGDHTREDIDRAKLHHHDDDNFKSFNENNDRVHLTHHDKKHLEQFDKLFDTHSRSISYSTAHSSGGGGGGTLGYRGLFSIGGSGGGSSQTQLAITNNQVDINQQQHGKVSDTDILDAKETGKHD